MTYRQERYKTAHVKRKNAFSHILKKAEVYKLMLLHALRSDSI